MNKVIIKEDKEIWKGSSSEEEEEEESKESVELQEQKELIDGYDEIQNIIKSMCLDMQKENPNIQNQLGGLIKQLEEQSNIVKQGIRGGRGKEKIIGKRLSSLTEEERKQYPSKQNVFTKQEIAERLKKFTRVNMDELFDIATKGIWLRYFKNEDGQKLFRTGGFITNIDPNHKYITLISHHSNKSFTWNMQIDTTHSVYIQTKNVKTYRLKQMDKKYNMLDGTSNMLNKWFTNKVELLTQMQLDSKSVIYIVYDKAYNKLYAPSRRQTNQKMLESLDISEEEFKKQLLKGLKNQLENPIDGIYIVGILSKSDLPKLKKMKSRIKEMK